MPNGQVEIEWGDGPHTFCIAKHAHAFELEDKCKSGVAEIYERIRDSKWHINDLRETIRLGLIGGGMKPLDALSLVKRYFDERPWAESINTALVILMAAMVGVPGDIVGKKEGAEQTATKETEVPSSAPPSTEPEQSLDGRQGKLTNAPPGSLPQESRHTIDPREVMKDLIQ